MSFEIELAGVEVFGHHGVTDEEQERGQLFLFDVRVARAAEPASDKLEDTVDYRALAACVREISDSRRFRLLETLAATLADALLERFEIERVRVRVRKPGVELDPPAAHAAVSVERRRG